MTEIGLPAPTPKAVRAKIANQTKTKELPQRNAPKQNPSKTAPPLEPRVVVVPIVPVDQSEDQAPLYPPNQLPDIPPNQPNIQQINQTLQQIPQTLHQIYPINHLTLQQIHPIQCSHKTLHPKYHN